ncbi:MAG: crossover junction endodeoxyribonuclease RuvC [Candidatus Binatia bacterium]
MRVLGVDPGTVVTGWGIVDCEGRSLARVASGTIRLGRGDLSQRLAGIYAELARVIALHRPGVMSLERNFVARNVQSAFRLGEARGVAMAVAAAADVSLAEYTPATIKKSVVGHGRAEKSLVQAAVVRIFSLEASPAEDEADALATAVCHGLRRGFEDKVAAALADEPVARPAAGRVRRGVTG